MQRSGNEQLAQYLEAKWQFIVEMSAITVHLHNHPPKKSFFHKSQIYPHMFFRPTFLLTFFSLPSLPQASFPQRVEILATFKWKQLQGSLTNTRGVFCGYPKISLQKHNFSSSNLFSLNASHLSCTILCLICKSFQINL